jgi:predicted mannosyl-3-phosphoglycerate phosphatase (HAD superfamily)
MFMIYSVLPWMLFIFICLRYKYIGGSKRKLDNSFEKTNYDDVDEQEISGINKFKKIRATV